MTEREQRTDHAWEAGDQNPVENAVSRCRRAVLPADRADGRQNQDRHAPSDRFPEPRDWRHGFQKTQIDRVALLQRATGTTHVTGADNGDQAPTSGALDAFRQVGVAFIDQHALDSRQYLADLLNEPRADILLAQLA